jgi:hypothetical protein
MSHWIDQLIDHYHTIRQTYPEDPLMIIFDVDGTLFDMRHLVLAILADYDHQHTTNHFQALQMSDITIHENLLYRFLEPFTISEDEKRHIYRWFLERRWQAKYLQTILRPFEGALALVRWFQEQPNVMVALNTGRLENVREYTLSALNAYGVEVGAVFASEFLFMHDENIDYESIAELKVAGVRHFQAQGYRVFAFVDNEPENLHAVASADPAILPVHVATLYESNIALLPAHSIGGTEFDGTLLERYTLPQK